MTSSQDWEEPVKEETAPGGGGMFLGASLGASILLCVHQPVEATEFQNFSLLLYLVFPSWVLCSHPIVSCWTLADLSRVSCPNPKKLMG